MLAALFWGASSEALIEPFKPEFHCESRWEAPTIGTGVTFREQQFAQLPFKWRSNADLIAAPFAESNPCIQSQSRLSVSLVLTGNSVMITLRRR